MEKELENGWLRYGIVLDLNSRQHDPTRIPKFSRLLTSCWYGCGVLVLAMCASVPMSVGIITSIGVELHIRFTGLYTVLKAFYASQ